MAGKSLSLARVTMTVQASDERRLVEVDHRWKLTSRFERFCGLGMNIIITLVSKQSRGSRQYGPHTLTGTGGSTVPEMRDLLPGAPAYTIVQIRR